MKPPTTTNQPEQPQLDNVQLILQRRAELAKQKAKLNLTETDAQLICTHSTEVQFDEGQIIIEEFHDINSVYRIKSGQVGVSRNGYQFNIIGKGWFIGDAMFIYNTPAYAMKGTMKALTPVVLEQVNLPFVQQLFQIDTILHAKVMRHLVSKYATLFEHLVNNLDAPYARYNTYGGSSSDSSDSSSSSSSSSPSSTPHVLTPTNSSSDLNPETAKILTAEIATTYDLSTTSSLESSSSVSSISSISSLSSNSSTSSSHISASPSPSPTSSSVPASPSLSSHSSLSSPASTPTSPSIGASSHRPTKREVRAREHASYKSYPLAHKGGGIQTLHIKSKKITVIAKSFGFSFKTKIDFAKIINITKVGESAVTILYQPHKVANVFFKKYYDREEFIGLINSLLNAQNSATEASKRLSGQALTVPHNPDLDYDEVPLCGGSSCAAKTGGACALMSNLTFKKGEIVFEEGDLFQRVYTLTKGHCEVWQKGKKLCTMEEGDIIGMNSLVHLRPLPITMIAGSEQVEMMMVPAYKLNSLIETDSTQAAYIYREAARALDRKISQAIGFLPNYKRIQREAKEKKEQEEKAGQKEAGEQQTQPQEVVV